jgi:hypothetical protein
MDARVKPGHDEYARLRVLAARRARSFARTLSLEKEGAGNAGCTLHPRSRVQTAQRKTHTSIQVQRRQSGVPAQWFYGLCRASPRRRIRLVTVVSGLTVLPDPVGLTKPPRTWRQQRASGPHGFAVRFGVVRPARRCSLTETALRTLARRRCRVHHIPSRVRDDRDTPLLPGKDGASW